jgi:hypothetical protein
MNYKLLSSISGEPVSELQQKLAEYTHLLGDSIKNLSDVVEGALVKKTSEFESLRGEFLWLYDEIGRAIRENKASLPYAGFYNKHRKKEPVLGLLPLNKAIRAMTKAIAQLRTIQAQIDPRSILLCIKTELANPANREDSTSERLIKPPLNEKTIAHIENLFRMLEGVDLGDSNAVYREYLAEYETECKLASQAAPIRRQLNEFDKSYAGILEWLARKGITTIDPISSATLISRISLEDLRSYWHAYKALEAFADQIAQNRVKLKPEVAQALFESLNGPNLVKYIYDIALSKVIVRHANRYLLMYIAARLVAVTARDITVRDGVQLSPDVAAFIAQMETMVRIKDGSNGKNRALLSEWKKIQACVTRDVVPKVVQLHGESLQLKKSCGSESQRVNVYNLKEAVVSSLEGIRFQVTEGGVQLPISLFSTDDGRPVILPFDFLVLVGFSTGAVTLEIMKAIIPKEFSEERARFGNILRLLGGPDQTHIVRPEVCLDGSLCDKDVNRILTFISRG